MHFNNYLRAGARGFILVLLIKLKIYCFKSGYSFIAMGKRYQCQTRLSINSSQTTAGCHIGLRTFLANSHDLVDLVLSCCIRRLAMRGNVSNVLLVT